MSKHTTTVSIGGQIYQIAGAEPEEYIQQVAAYTDAALKQMMQNNRMISRYDATVLAAVNLADEVLKNRRAANDLRTQLDQRLAKEAETRRELQQLRAEIERLHDQVRREQNEVRRLKGSKK